MTARPLFELSIAEAGRRLRDGTITSAALTEDALARIAAIDGAGQLHHRDGRTRAGRRRRGRRGLRQGRRPRADAGRALCAEGHLRHRRHPHDLPFQAAGRPRARYADSAVTAKFTAQGAVLLGKLATHEFAIGGPSFDLPFPPARNPWNREHIPGGSSSGSAAAVAAGLVRMAMGTDTGGSIRGPAAYCGTVGLKPTYGLVSRRGVFPLSTTLDHCGPLSWTIEDSAIALAGRRRLRPARPGQRRHRRAGLPERPAPRRRGPAHRHAAALLRQTPRA